MSGVQPFVDLGQVKGNMRNLTSRLRDAAHAVVDNDFIQMENFAKSNAPWQDRTGDARRSIQKKDLSNQDYILFYLIIGVSYGLYLELANQGKFQILRPTMTVFEPQLKKHLGALK